MEGITIREKAAFASSRHGLRVSSQEMPSSDMDRCLNLIGNTTGLDGNLRLYTYYDKVDIGAWEVTFTLFDRDSSWESECQLPEKGGKFGLCEDNQCVACPSPNGLQG
ncbi:unnamed protein product [Dovyalis caffra]|uniref:Uncharacterized protein n=1 Tax=Dovyalis caffra TaxID=77055 RepID=A0AAV1R3Q7_9ROSI|nr:unnamed protein product [Dovyalis caffra]